MVENQDELKFEIGNEEAVLLKPSVVEIVNVAVIEVGDKKARKLVWEVKHPDAQDIIKISAVKYESKGKLETSGLWVNLDSKGLIRKGSALVTFLNFVGAKNSFGDLKGKRIQTAQDEKGYLVFKAY